MGQVRGFPCPPPAWDWAGLSPLGTKHRLLLGREKAYLHLPEPIMPVPRSSLSHSPLHLDNLSLLEDCPCQPSRPLLLVLRAEKGHALPASSAPFSRLLPASSRGFRKEPGTCAGLGRRPVPDGVLGALVRAWAHRGQGLGEGSPPGEARTVILVTSNGELWINRVCPGSVPRLSPNPPLPSLPSSLRPSLSSQPHFGGPYLCFRWGPWGWGLRRFSLRFPLFFLFLLLLIHSGSPLLLDGRGPLGGGSRGFLFLPLPPGLPSRGGGQSPQLVWWRQARRERVVGVVGCVSVNWGCRRAGWGPHNRRGPLTTLGAHTLLF